MLVFGTLYNRLRCFPSMFVISIIVFSDVAENGSRAEPLFLDCHCRVSCSKECHGFVARCCPAAAAGAVLLPLTRVVVLEKESVSKPSHLMSHYMDVGAA